MRCKLLVVAFVVAAFAVSSQVAAAPPVAAAAINVSDTSQHRIRYAVNRYVQIQVAQREPYCYGGAGSACFDCSGLTMMAWKQAGISLPHSSAAQYNVGRRISASELQPGDLIFYYSPISHVSIYIGGGQRISATHTGDYVRVQSLGSSIVGYARPNG